MDGEHVGFLDALRVDALVTLHVTERREAIAADGRPLEVQRLGGGVHVDRHRHHPGARVLSRR
mgnify:CR=1 FL=1